MYYLQYPYIHTFGMNVYIFFSPTYRYFTVLGKWEGLQWMEVEPERGEFILANNGWVLDNPPIDFASEDSQVW